MVRATEENAPDPRERVAESAWETPHRRPRGPFHWRRFLWSLIVPPRGHRIAPTISGLVLVALALGIGTAAYNTANNILFITLALLLACLILSGVLSWINFHQLAWRLRVEPPLRAGETTPVVLELQNRKTLLPVYGLWFDLTAEASATKARVHLRHRLDPGTQRRLEWAWRPERRGRETLRLLGLGSMFPFGFLRKSFGSDLSVEVIVWPAPVDYAPGVWGISRRHGGGLPTRHVGHGSDLLALRRYATGDSHRHIHWKASARQRQLLVRQFAAEGQEAYFLWLAAPPGRWERPEQWELACGLAATLAEDLFRVGRLAGGAVAGGPPVRVKRVRDLESLLDQIALAPTADAINQPDPAAVPVAPSGERLDVRSMDHLLTFAPDGLRGVVAHVHGKLAASA